MKKYPTAYLKLMLRGIASVLVEESGLSEVEIDQLLHLSRKLREELEKR